MPHAMQKKLINEGRMIFSGPLEDFDNYLTPNTINVSLGAAPSRLQLEAIPGVVSAESLGGIRYKIHFSSSPQEVIEQIVWQSVREDWKLVEIAQQKSSLDTIFAELSKKSQ